MTVDYKGQVAIVTGAGGGLGRAHAVALAARGARVVVNDIGGAVSGDGGDAAPADTVVKEIIEAGGQAVANYDSVTTAAGAAAIVKTAVDAFGGVDILVNNAGILRDRTFRKADLADVRAVLDVHLWGTINCTHAVWPLMMESRYGRVIMTTSIAGTSGNFGQSAYGTAKLGMIGLLNTLAIEGERNGVLVNAISPGAATRMTEGLNPAAVDRYLHAELVTPAVLYLASDSCSVTGQVIQAMAGGYSRLHMFETEGVQLDPAEPVSPEMIADHFDELTDLSTATPTTPGAAGRIEQRLRSIGRWEE